MKKNTLLFLLVAVLSLGLLIACGGDDGTDGDVDGDDTTDGDTEAVDGDNATDGDTEEAADGDQEFVFKQCTAETDHLCFAIDSTELQGNYDYILRSELPTSGCDLSNGTYTVEFYESSDSWSKMVVKIESYTEAGKYNLPNNTIQVNLTLVGENSETKKYLSMNPCTLTVSNEVKGIIECTMYDLDDSSTYFNLLGSWLCSE